MNSRTDTVECSALGHFGSRPPARTNVTTKETHKEPSRSEPSASHRSTHTRTCQSSDETAGGADRWGLLTTP